MFPRILPNTTTIAVLGLLVLSGESFKLDSGLAKKRALQIRRYLVSCILEIRDMLGETVYTIHLALLSPPRALRFGYPCIDMSLGLEIVQTHVEHITGI